MAFDNLRIIRLQAENIKRLVVVDITPNGDTVTIAGRNGQGKTSVLDSILWAMSGGRSIQWKPIRDGETKAKIRLELGNSDGLQLVVTRTFEQKEGAEVTTKLDVRSADGMKPAGAQTFLENLVGSLSFDPNAFSRADTKRQVEILKGLIRSANPEADFDGIARERQKAFDERTEAKRSEAQLRASSAGALPEGDPLDEEPMVDVQALLDRLGAIGEQAQARAQAEQARDRTDRSLQEAEDRSIQLRAQIATLAGQLAESEKLEADLEKAIAERKPLPEVEDASAIRTEMSEADLRNRAIAHRNTARETMKGANEKAALVERLTDVIKDCDAKVRDLIERADLQVNGLELGPDRVMLRGVPFDQASDAEQLRASMALGMAANPKLRVLRIRDGSLLDDDALRVINEVAGDMNFQVWMERVGEGDDGAFVLEAGMLKA